MSALPVAVQSTTWDGYVAFATDDGDQCRAVAVRPQHILASTHAVEFAPAVFSTGMPCPQPLGHHGIVADPDVDLNPHPSDAAGNPDDDGDHLAYQTLVYREDGDRIAVQSATIVIADPMTPNAEVVHVAFGATQVLQTVEGAAILGVTPTVTADGGLLIFQGGASVAEHNLMYSRRLDPDAGLGAGWTTPRAITELVLERDEIVDGARLGDRYPIADDRFRAPTGQMFPFGYPYRAANPWISPDGSELFHASARGGEPGPNGERVRAAGVSAVGRGTGYVVRHIDGPINPSREALGGAATMRQFIASPGQSRGFRRPYRETAPVIPIDDGRTYGMFVTGHDGETAVGSYSEVAFDVVADADYTLYFPMNEFLNVIGDFSYDPTRTADLSESHHVGSLEGGAAFAVEAFGLDEDGRPRADDNTGAHGRAIYFTENGRVRVPLAWTTLRAGPATTVELYVQRLADLDEEAQYLAQWPGVCDLVLGSDGRIEATVYAGGQARSSGAVGPALPTDVWTHVALTYDAPSGTLRTWVDGQPVGETAFSPALLDDATGDIVIGPAGLSQPQTDGTVPVLAIDEFAISRVARSAEEIARAAGRFTPAQRELDNASLLSVVDLPVGLRVEELLVPASNPVTAEAVELGRLLFFDPRLSRDGSISCGTCHDPAFGWADGRVTGLGIDDQVLGLNTPTILNRAWSDAQFWNGRAETLEMQALGPIVSPAEMDASLWEVVEFLRSVPEYVERFDAAFGTEPNEDGIARALASFQRTVVSGNSPVDRYEAGDTSALTEPELRGRTIFSGKGRCIACHDGANFTDEQFHFTGLVPITWNELGRYAVTRRREDLHAFKTPTLRNVAETAPYFHDGSAATLEEVVAIYNAGGSTPGHDWEIRPLDLNAEEQADLVAFLRALSDPDATAMVPPELPPSPQ